ncbi:MAG: hypothetical protein KatS3mg111_1628 [Pirellulaceae bacterium]|nr:MAG: hypothetical protein KatS3mg111_1628 [Pirellulaceae bacterium]
MPHDDDPVREVVEAVESGKPLVDVLADGESEHARMLRAAIECGEATGDLAGPVQWWTELMVQRVNAGRRLWLALWYPALFMVLGWLVMGLVLRRNVPLILDFYEQMWRTQPAWLKVLNMVHRHHVSTLMIVGLAMLVPAAVYAYRTTGIGGDRLPRNGARRCRRWSMAAEVSARMLQNRQPLKEVVRLATLASGATVEEAAVAFEAIRQQRAVPLLGPNLNMVFRALHGGVVAGDRAVELLQEMAVQFRDQAAAIDHRRGRRLPMVMAGIAGMTILFTYVGLVYFPWVNMLRDVVDPATY